jgi:hypothetical protein
MRNQQILLPYVLIGFGVIYLIKPDIFHSFLTRRKPLDQQHAMPPQNVRFMRRLGMIFIVCGIAILAYWGRLH